MFAGQSQICHTSKIRGAWVAGAGLYELGKQLPDPPGEEGQVNNFCKYYPSHLR